MAFQMKALLFRDQARISSVKVRLLSVNMSEAIRMQMWSNSNQFLYHTREGLISTDVAVLLVHKLIGKQSPYPDIVIGLRTCA